jgi:hypothetical protein
MFSARRRWLRSSFFHNRTTPTKPANPDAIAECWHPDHGGDFILCPDLIPERKVIEQPFELVLPTPVKHSWWAHFFGRTKQPKK